jgi:hypothetical protein
VTAAGGSRAVAETSLAKALSRSIGYTTAAYNLDRIVKALDILQDKASVYKEEMVFALNSGEDTRVTLGKNTDGYTSETPNFTSAMGLIETVSAREARLHRYAATELGRSLLGAKACGDIPFYRYFLSRVVMLADADFLVPILAYHQNKIAQPLPDWFATYQGDLREQRWEWLRKAMPEPLLLQRVAAQISWLAAPKSRVATFQPEFPTLNTARHHALPRRGWLEDLGLLDPSGRALTRFGADALASLTPGQRYFWLGPGERVQDDLRIPLDVQAPGPFEDGFNFLTTPAAPADKDQAALVADLADVMIAAFDSARLVHARQAPLRLAVEYVAFRAYRDRVAYRWEDALNALFTVYRGRIERLSAHTGQMGFYRLRLA